MPDIKKVIQYLQDYDRDPDSEYHVKLNYLVNSYNEAVYTRNILKQDLKRDIEREAKTIRESPNIGTVKDNSRLGMKIAYESVLKRLNELEKWEEQRVNIYLEKRGKENV